MPVTEMKEINLFFTWFSCYFNKLHVLVITVLGKLGDTWPYFVFFAS